MIVNTQSQIKVNLKHQHRKPAAILLAHVTAPIAVVLNFFNSLRMAALKTFLALLVRKRLRRLFIRASAMHKDRLL